MLFYFLNWIMDKQAFLILLIFTRKCALYKYSFTSQFLMKTSFSALVGTGGVEAGLGASKGPWRAVNGDQGRGGGAHAVYTGRKGGTGLWKQRFYEFCRDGEELKHEGGEKRQGALRGLGDSAAEPKGPDAWLGPSSRPPISGHPLGQSLGLLLSPSFPRPPPSSPIGAISGAKRVQRSGRGPPW